MTDNTQPIIGRYRILGQLGQGGMATVFKAYDTHLDVEVAIKFIRTENLAPVTLGRALKRFEREAKALAKMIQPNIVKVLDYGEFKGRPYLVMPLLTGGTLKQKLNGQPMPWKDAVRLLLPITRALAYAHQQGTIHRDVKPANILLTSSGDPMLADFGIAKIIDEEATMDLTGTSAMVGTPDYMAPEQITSKTVDTRADIYSLGVVFYEMVTGRRPFVADTPMAVLLKHASEPLPRPKQFVPSLPDGVETILSKALAKKPADRYQSMDEFGFALDNLLAGRPTTDANAAPPYPADEADTLVESYQPGPAREASWLDRGWVWAVGAVAVCMCALGSLGMVSVGIKYFATPTPSPLPRPTSTLTVTAAPMDTETALPSPTPTEVPTKAFTPTAVPNYTHFADAKNVLMRLVPAGEFTMGMSASQALKECNKYNQSCELSWFSDEEPPHTVYLDSYYMDVYEVTNSLYEACVNAGVCKAPTKPKSDTRSQYYGNPQFDNYPVIYVGWEMAQTFCQWRGGSLPTEAQWEKAARGTDGRTYPWGEGLDCEHANYGRTDVKYCQTDTTAVGSYEIGISPYGLYDMAGNVLEWVADWYSKTYYKDSLLNNPFGPDSGQNRVMRGGSWKTQEAGVQSARRAWTPVDSYFERLGFRCAAPVP